MSSRPVDAAASATSAATSSGTRTLTTCASAVPPAATMRSIDASIGSIESSREHDVGALRAEGLGDGASDPARSARHHRSSARKGASAVCGCSRRRSREVCGRHVASSFRGRVRGRVRGGAGRSHSSTPARERPDITEMIDTNDPIDRTEPNDMIDPSERALPTDPIERTLPTDPMDSTEPFDPMLSTDELDAIDKRLGGTRPG